MRLNETLILSYRVREQVFTKLIIYTNELIGIGFMSVWEVDLSTTFKNEFVSSLISTIFMK